MVVHINMCVIVPGLCDCVMVTICDYVIVCDFVLCWCVRGVGKPMFPSQWPDPAIGSCDPPRAYTEPGCSADVGGALAKALTIGFFQGAMGSSPQSWVHAPPVLPWHTGHSS